MENTLVVIGLVILVIAVCREITCWYFKYTHMLHMLTEIRDLLAKLVSRSPDGAGIQIGSALKEPAMRLASPGRTSHVSDDLYS